MRYLYCFLGLVFSGGVVFISRFAYCKYLLPRYEQFQRDRAMLNDLKEGKGQRYLRTHGCWFNDSTLGAVIKVYMLKKHSPKPCGIFFANEISKESPEKQQEILRRLVERLKEMPFEYRTKFVGEAKNGQSEYGNDKTRQVGKKLAEMLDQAFPYWRTED